ncbi:acyltransferase, partial [Escherichia coli]
QARGQDISRANALTSAYAPTAAMQNYNQYAQMLKADPEGAAAFAAAAGINTNAKKLMSVRENDDGTVTKYYTDGSEEQGKLNQPISGDGFRPISLPTAQKIMEKSPEGAKKAAGFAYRVRDALDSIDTLKDQLSPQRVAIINNALGNGTLANLTLSPAEQQYVVNANDAIMAILRQETGAAIAPAETSKYYQMYFPQPGDSTKTIDTKRRKMENQFNSLKAASGRTYDALRVISAVDRGTASSSQTLPQSEQVSQPAASSNFSSLWGD